MFGGLFGSKAQEKAIQEIPENLPRGLYLYGDVGSGKTMLMDLFYETLPQTVKSKTRIHFHNFMQDIHKRLHKMKMEHGNDIDGVPFVAADIAKFCIGNIETSLTELNIISHGRNNMTEMIYFCYILFYEV